ncbi:MAG: peptidoglycan DD-metalloendopeptidase family protein [Candidatus Krumholzibacteriota bacterium]|nr:peptidoglycan DD-metalloendopeptidase family protein [Candidatus Krumholzibacteriota bacterium]
MRNNRIVSALIIAGTIASISYLTIKSDPKQNLEPAAVASIQGYPDETAVLLNAPPVTPDPVHSGVVTKNSFFFNILEEGGIPPRQIDAIIRASKPVYDFGRIQPGQYFEIFTDPEGELEKLTFSLKGTESYVEVVSVDGNFVTNRKDYPFEVVVKEASGIITSSFFASLIEQGLSNELGAKIANIYAWDIDFFSQIMKNDYFRVVYEEKTMLDGPGCSKGKAIGNILAAEFNTSGEKHYAFLFQNEDDFADYFDDQGRSLRKQLLRAPLNYTRISSNYSKNRLHPVLHTYRPHLGIDYAAPTGTPVQSTGDGTIMTASRTRANGNYIKVRHNSNYISYYLHLSRFAKGISKGTKVKQGQTIGYVGATGYATGPHLDYRVKKNGSFVNPRKLKLPPAKPVDQEKMAAYLIFAGEQIASLNQIPIRDPRGDYYAEKSAEKGSERYGKDSDRSGSNASD